MVPPNKQLYEGKTVRDNVIEMRVEINELSKNLNNLTNKFDEHCKTNGVTRRFDITTGIAIISIIVSTIVAILVAVRVGVGI